MRSITQMASDLYLTGDNVPFIAKALSNEIRTVTETDVWVALLKTGKVKFYTPGVTSLAKEIFFEYLDRRPKADLRPMVVVQRNPQPAVKRRKARPARKFPNGSLKRAGITIGEDGKWNLPGRRP